LVPASFPQGKAARA